MCASWPVQTALDKSSLQRAQTSAKFPFLQASVLPEIDIEICQCSVSAHQHQIGHVEVSRIQQIKLALQVEVQQPLHCTMRGDDSCWDTGILCLPLSFTRVLVLVTLGK